MRNITENISLKKLSWLAALPISLAAFGASVIPAQASEKYHDSYNSHTPKYSYCSLWEHRHEYRCTGYYQPKHEPVYHKPHHEPVYYQPRHEERYYPKKHNNSYHSEWKR